MKAIFITKDGLKSYPEKIKTVTIYYFRPVMKLVRTVSLFGSLDEFTELPTISQIEYELVEIKNKIAYYKEI